MGCERHDIVYYGALNIYLGEELLKVIEAWRCRRCGAIRVGSRWPALMASTEGLLHLLEPDAGRWMVLVKRGNGDRPEAEPIAVRPGDVLRIDTPIKDEAELIVGQDYSLTTAVEHRTPTSIVAYLLEEIIKGYIDLSTWPPTVVTLTHQSR